MLEELIACPNPDHGNLVRQDDHYICERCGASFAIRNGIPVLLPTRDAQHG